MGRDQLPTEEEQYEAYKAVLEGMSGKPVVVRTLDIGGDKELPYLELTKRNESIFRLPGDSFMLGGSRIFSVHNFVHFYEQVVYGNLKIMFPMIATLDEFRAAKAILEEEKAKLRSGRRQGCRAYRAWYHGRDSIYCCPC